MVKKKILFIIESLGGGGAEKVLTTLLRHIDRNLYEITIFAIVDNGKDLEEVMPYAKFRCALSNNIGRNRLKYFLYVIKYNLIYHIFPCWLVYKLFIPKGFDVEVSFIEGFVTKLIAFSNNLKIKQIAWVHIDLKNYPWTQQQGIYKSFEEEQQAYKRFDKVVCVSHSVENVMKEYYGLNNTCTIYNPIDVEYINQKAEEKVKFMPAAGFNIVSVGRLVPQKGYDLLLPIIARLHNEGLNVNLYILGEGEERKKLEALISSHDESDYIHLMGYHTNPHAIVSKMDLFVCSSRAEGYSLVIAEALSMGIPVISTNCSGPNELLDNNRYGILCDGYDELYEKIKEVVETPELRKELHEKALKRRETFNVKYTIEKVKEIM